MNELREFKTFADEITATTSRLKKLEILFKYKDNEAVKYFLNFLYNPYITTGISEKKLNKPISDLSSCLWLDYPEDTAIFEYIKNHNTGRDSDIKAVQEFREQLIPVDLHYLYNALITKNLNLGIDAKTINKVISGLIPEFNIALANKYFDNPAAIEGKEFAITTKIDGGRIIAFKENGMVSFFTRAGQKYEGLIDLETELANIAEDNFVLDGELTLLDKGNLVSKEQYKETMKISRKDGSKHGLKMLVFDFLPLEDFKAQHSIIPYSERRARLNSLFTLNPNLIYFNLLPILYTGTDTNKIMEFLNKNIAAGEEGIMLNDVNAPYQFKRSNALLKVKKMNDLDLEVIGFEEGTNRHAGRLGALIVDYKGNKVKVGSGFSDELRDEIWQHKDEYLGTIVEVSYFEETSNQDGGISLRFPVFKDFRPDKIKPSC